MNNQTESGYKEKCPHSTGGIVIKTCGERGIRTLEGAINPLLA